VHNNQTYEKHKGRSLRLNTATELEAGHILTVCITGGTFVIAFVTKTVYYPINSFGDLSNHS